MVAEDQLTPADRAERGSYVGCIAGALSKSEYLDGLAAAGFVDAEVRFTHEAAPGMHGAIVRAVKPSRMTTRPTLRRRLAAEFVGSLLLADVVVGSGIAAQQLSPSDVGLQLIENAGATALGLFVIILMFGPVSGAHFNPVVSLVDAAFGGLRRRTARPICRPRSPAASAAPCWPTSCSRGRAVAFSTTHRMTGPHFVSEVVATTGLVLIIFALARTGRTRSTPAAVGAYIGAAYFFTSCTSFANPAITIGRMFSDTFAGIAPCSAPGYIAASSSAAPSASPCSACSTPTWARPKPRPRSSPTKPRRRRP